MDIGKQHILTFKEVVNILAVKPSWLRSQIFKKQIPYYKLNGIIRFNQIDLMKWLETKRTH